MQDFAVEKGGSVRRWTIVIYLLILTMISAGDLSAGTLTKEFNTTVEFISGGAIFVENINGKIEIESWNRNSVKIFAYIQVKSSNKRKAEDILDKVKIIVEKNGDKLIIRAEYPRQCNNGFLSWLFGKGVSVKVDFVVMVPSESDLDIESVNGRLNVKDVKGNCDFSTTNGTIVAEGMDGSVNANSTNGSIRIQMDALQIRTKIIVRTVNGGLKLILPENPSAKVRASTVNGSIHTDFDLNVRGKFNSRSIRGEIGQGDATLNLKTVNGSIGLYTR